MKRLTICLLLIFQIFAVVSRAQSVTGSNVVSSALPFLSIAPDSRGGAIGDIGAASSPDIVSQHYNPAKYAFMKSNSGISLSYTPWLRALVNDMNLAYLVGYHKLDEVQTLSSSFRYFDLGSITFYSESGATMDVIAPNEFAFDMGYSRKLSDTWSGSVVLRYMRSDIFQGQEDLYAGNSFAADVAFFYSKDFRKARKQSNLSYGINISNIGNKLSYDQGSIKDFIPTNLRTGFAYTTEIDQYNQISFMVDLNKLLIPSLLNKKNIEEWRKGQISDLRNIGNNEYGVIEGMFRSFTDAPEGFQEEIKEITLSLGAEYWYSKQFALRAGYFHEAEEKGARQFVTFGAGLKMNVFTLDFSYIYTLSRTSPLENTLRFTLGFDLDDFQKQGRRR